MFQKSVKQYIQDIVTYTLVLAMAQEFHSEAIKFGLDAVTTQFNWHSEYVFQGNDLQLSIFRSKILKKSSVPNHKEPHRVVQNWDDFMAFMLCGTYLKRQSILQKIYWI